METRESHRKMLVSPFVLKLFSAGALLLLLLTLYQIIKPFLVPLGWSAVVALVIWPLFVGLRRVSKLPIQYVALLFTLGFAVLVVGGAAPLSGTLSRQIGETIQLIQEKIAHEDGALQQQIAELPLVGGYIAQWLDHFPNNSAELADGLKAYHGELLNLLRGAVGGLFRTIFRFLVFLFCLYFMLRWGSDVGAQLKRAAFTLGGARYLRVIDTVSNTVRAAVHGMLLTAALQSILAGIGFKVAGAPVPILLASVTFLFALTPFGPAMLYLPVAAIMVAKGSTWYVGLGLAAWGIAVVSTIDNVVRPIFIGATTGMPLLLVFFGAIGGLASFGPLGLFLGPATLAVALGLWRELTLSETDVG